MACDAPRADGGLGFVSGSFALAGKFENFLDLNFRSQSADFWVLSDCNQGKSVMGHEVFFNLSRSAVVSCKIAVLVRGIFFILR